MRKMDPNKMLKELGGKSAKQWADYRQNIAQSVAFHMGPGTR